MSRLPKRTIPNGCTAYQQVGVQRANDLQKQTEPDPPPCGHTDANDLIREHLRLCEEASPSDTALGGGPPDSYTRV